MSIREKLRKRPATRKDGLFEKGVKCVLILQTLVLVFGMIIIAGMILFSAFG